MQWFPGHQPGSLSNVRPESNLSVENVPFFNFSPSVKSFFFSCCESCSGNRLFIFCKILLCVIINIYDDYSISGKWPHVMNINFL